MEVINIRYSDAGFVWSRELLGIAKQKTRRGKPPSHIHYFPLRYDWMIVYRTVRVSVGRRLLYGAGFAIIWASINIWIPVLGWALLVFTPIAFFVPIIAMREKKEGVCPYCEAIAVHRFQNRSFKCGQCRQRIIVSDTQL